MANSAVDKLMIFFLIFPSKLDLTIHANCLLRRQFAWSVKSYFLGKIRKIFQNIVCWNFYPVFKVYSVQILSVNTMASDEVLFSSKKVWYFSYFTMKIYVVGIHQKCLDEVLLMNTHNICFHGEIRKIFIGHPLIWSYEIWKLFGFGSKLVVVFLHKLGLLLNSTD